MRAGGVEYSLGRDDGCFFFVGPISHNSYHVRVRTTQRRRHKHYPFPKEYRSCALYLSQNDFHSFGGATSQQKNAHLPPSPTEKEMNTINIEDKLGSKSSETKKKKKMVSYS